MIKRSFLACVVVTAYLISLGRAGRAGQDSPTIRKLKTLYPRTVLVDSGRPRSFIVVPDGDDEYAALARNVQRIVERETTATLVVKPATALVDDNWRIDFKAIDGQNMIALGNVNNNRLLSVLYGERYVVADSIYPGKGGYVVRTVHDPFARGVNVLVLAGSDAAGVAKAIAVFAHKFAKARDRSLVLDEPIVDVQFEKKAYRFFPDATHYLSSKRQPQYTGIAWFKDQLKRAGFMDEAGRVVTNRNPKATLVTLTGWIARIGQTYFRTGNKELLPLMKELLSRNRALLRRPAKLHGMGGRSAEHVHEWDLLEELPIWTDEDRLEITNALLSDARLGHEPRAFHRQVREGYVQTMDENHGTFSALHSYHAWHYFHKYYKLPESEYWMRCASAVFSAQASTFQIPEDASVYLCYCPIASMDYSLESGNLLYFKRGIARHHARYVALACMNNLGLNTGFGDSPGLVCPAFFELIAPAAWYYRDPRLYWIVRNALPTSCGLRIFQKSIAIDLTVEPQKPTQWTGLIRIPLYEAPLAKGQVSKTPIFAPKRELDPTLFNKLIFKQNWDADGQYLLLDGAGCWGGPPGPHGHKHDDINTIINFTSQRRMWLVDHTYQMRRFADHSGVYVLRNGQGGYKKRTLARLKQFFQTPTWAMTKTSFMNWNRNVFWRKGLYFVVLDEVVAEQDGDYFARCSLRALGHEALKGNTLFLEQKGRFCKIVSDGRAALDVDRYAFTDTKHWRRFYPYAEPIAKIFQEDKSKRLRKGQSLTFVNLLYAYGSKARENAVDMTLLSDTRALIAEGDKATLIGIGAMPGALGQADMFVLSPEEVVVAGCDGLLGGLLHTDLPCSLGLDLVKGDLYIGASKDVTVRVRGGVQSCELDGKAIRKVESGGWTKVRVNAGTHVLAMRGWTELGRARAAATRAVSAAKARSVAQTAARKAKPPKPAVEGLRLRAVRLGQPIRRIVVADIDGGPPEWIVGTETGLTALRPDGTRLWSFHTGRPVRAVDVADVDGDGVREVALGCDDARVYLLDNKGRKRWSYRCKASQGRIAGPPCVDYVKIADLERDGSKEIVVGANWVHVLTAAGKVKWERYMEFRRGRIVGDFVSGAVTDLDGDGTEEIVASFLTSYPILQVLDVKGRLVVPRDGGRYGHPGFNIGVPVAVAALNLFGKGNTKQIICATTGGIRFFWHDQKRREQAGGKAAGTFVNMTCFVPKASQRTQPAATVQPLIFGATSMCGLECVTVLPRRRDRWIRPKVLWYRTLGEKITALLAADLDADGRGEVYVGTKRGNVYVLDVSSGRTVGTAKLQGAQVNCFAADKASKAALAGLGDGQLIELKPAR